MYTATNVGRRIENKKLHRSNETNRRQIETVAERRREQSKDIFRSKGSFVDCLKLQLSIEMENGVLITTLEVSSDIFSSRVT